MNAIHSNLHCIFHNSNNNIRPDSLLYTIISAAFSIEKETPERNDTGTQCNLRMLYIIVDTHIAMKQTLKFMRHKSYNNVCIKEIDFSYITKHKSLNDMFRTSRQRERIIIKSHKNCIFRINAFLFPFCIILALIESGRVHIRCIHILFFCGLFIAFYSCPFCNVMDLRETIQNDHNLYTEWICDNRFLLLFE